MQMEKRRKKKQKKKRYSDQMNKGKIKRNR